MPGRMKRIRNKVDRNDDMKAYGNDRGGGGGGAARLVEIVLYTLTMNICLARQLYIALCTDIFRALNQI